MNWYLTSLKKYHLFLGRARRKEYWFFHLNNNLILLCLLFIDVQTVKNGYVIGSYVLFILPACITLGVRRLHDVNRSGWWMFILLIPIYGSIVFFYFMALDSDKKTNQYGVIPK